MSKHRAARQTAGARNSNTVAQASQSATISTGKLILVGCAIVAWLVIYLATPLRDLGPRTASGGPRRRFDLLLHYLLLPEALIEQWLGSPPEFAVFDRLPILLGAAGIICIAGATGWLLMRCFSVDRGLTRLEVLIFSLGVGLSCVSLYSLAAGLAGLLRQPVMFAIPAIAVVVAAIIVWRRMPQENADTSRPKSDEGAFSGRCLWLAAPLVAVVLCGGMLPPADFDVREYHLQASKEFYQLGRITFLPHNVYANMPLGAEMLCLPAMSLTGDWWLGALIGKTVIACFAPLTALALYAAGRRWVSTSAGVVAAIAYLAIPGTIVVSVSGLIDAALAFYLLLTLYAALLGTARSSLAGFLAGSALAVKYPGLLFVVLPLTVWTAWRGELSHSLVPAPAGGQSSAPLRSALRHTAIFLAAATVAGGPWLLKNAVLAGNPVYPLMYGLFDGESRTPEKHAQWQRAHSPPNYRPQDLFGRVADIAIRGELASPILLPLAAIAFIRWRGLPTILLGYLLFLFATWWLLTHRIDRFFLPAMPLAALLAGMGADRLVTLGWRRTVVGLLIFTVTGSVIMTASPEGYASAPGSPIAFVRYFVGLERLRDSPQRIDPWHVYLNHHTPEGSAVILVGDAAVFDLRMPTYYSTVFDSCLFEHLAAGRTSAEIHQELLTRNVAYLYVDWGDIDRYRSPGNYDFTAFIQRELFQRLVADGVLDPSLPESELIRTGIVEVQPDDPPLDLPGEVYPVRPPPRSGAIDHPS